MHKAIWGVLVLAMLGYGSGCAIDAERGMTGDGAVSASGEVAALPQPIGAASTTQQVAAAGADTDAGSAATSQPAIDEEATTVPTVPTTTAKAPANSEVRRANREALARQLVNPISDLVRLPVRFDYDEGLGPEGAGRYAMSLQPVIPIRLSDEWNLITRTNVPLVYREPLVPGGSDQFGLGDIAESMFFCPQYRKHLWGIGPAFVFPTATDDALGGQQWAAGPNFIGVRQMGPWTGGFIAAQLWSFTGSDDRPDINVTAISPFIAFTTPNAFTVTLETDSVFDWTTDQWLVPINLSIGKVTRLRDDMVNVAIGARYYADPPENAPEWGLRLTITYLFPR